MLDEFLLLLDRRQPFGDSLVHLRHALGQLQVRHRIHVIVFVVGALRPGDGSEAFRRAVSESWLPSLRAFRPALLCISAGFDAHGQDPSGDLRLQADDYGWIGAELQALAAELCDGRVVAMLEGGYNLATLGRCVGEFVRPFLAP